MRAELERVLHAACARLDAGMLAAASLDGVPEGAAIIALGKVAYRQVSAVLAARPDLVPILAIGPENRPDPWFFAGDHPLPGEHSFAAGRRLLDAVRALDGRPIVALVSGGGSALVEWPVDGMTPEQLISEHRRLLRSDLGITRMNAERRKLSAIKGGELLRAAPRSQWFVRVLSDVVGDDPSVVASGPCTPEKQGDPEIELKVLAGPRQLAFVASREATSRALVVAPVTEDVEAVADRYAEWAVSNRGLLVAAGEPTIRITGTGSGGRAQHLALLMADRLAGKDATFLAAGSDGRDGDTKHAGAVVDGLTASRAGSALQKAILHFDSAPLHARIGTAIPSFEPVTHLGELHLLWVA